MRNRPNQNTKLAIFSATINSLDLAVENFTGYDTLITTTDTAYCGRFTATADITYFTVHDGSGIENNEVVLQAFKLTNLDAVAMCYDTVSASQSGYAYRYNGQKISPEIGTGHQTALYWEYDARTGRRWNLDPVRQYFISQYATFGGNPVLKNDVLGDREGDYYSKDGKYLGNDGIDDNKVYITDVKSVEEATESGVIDWEKVKKSNRTIDLTKTRDIYHTEFLQFAARIYNETYGSSETEKRQLANAIGNRYQLKGVGGDTWQLTLDRIAYWFDSQEQRMSPERRSPASNARTKLGNVKLSLICEKNYQNYYNSSFDERNGDTQMRLSTSSTIFELIGLIGDDDLVKGAYQWRGDGKKNHFYKIKRDDTKY